MKKVFNYKRESKQNPYIGFTSFQHFRNDELYSDLIVKPENNMTETEHVECYPVPDYVEEKGRAQGYYPDCSVVYIRILWKEFEPVKGEFNYKLIDDVLQKARDNDQLVMFRLLTHSTRESDDVPDWVKLEIECPRRPEGARFKESPKDPEFLNLFGYAIKKIGERYDNDPTFSMFDVSMPGAWGEGDSIEFFTEEQIKAFCDIYTDNFKNTTLIGQVIPWTVNYMNEQAPVGWRADCIGRPNLTFGRVPSQEAQMPDVWKRGHVSFESYWWLGEWKRQGWDCKSTLDALLKMHASTFNAKSLPIPYEWQEIVDDFIAKMGYHYAIDSVELAESVKAGDKLSVKLAIDNVGVAPIYNEMPLKLILKGNGVEKVFETDVDIRKWMPGKAVEDIEIAIPTDLAKGEYKLGIALGGGRYPVVVFATDAEADGDAFILANIEIK